MLSLKGRWLFVHVAKTGGNSLQSVLAAQSEDRLTSDRHRDGVEDFEVAGDITGRKHMSLQEYHHRLPANVYERLFRFAVVRNPWERAVSAYFGPIQWALDDGPPEWSRPRFEQLLEAVDPAMDMLSVDGRLDIDMVLRYETLDEDACVLFHRLGLGARELPHRNRSLVSADWRTWYAQDPGAVDVVAERYSSDIETFGYRFEPRRGP